MVLVGGSTVLPKGLFLAGLNNFCWNQTLVLHAAIQHDIHNEHMNFFIPIRGMGREE